MLKVYQAPQGEMVHRYRKHNHLSDFRLLQVTGLIMGSGMCPPMLGILTKPLSPGLVNANQKAQNLAKSNVKREKVSSTTESY